MTRLFLLVGVLGVCSSAAFTNVHAAPTPIFYAPLESEAEIEANNAGDVVDTSVAYVPGIVGNAFQSTSNATDGGGWARWNDAAVTSIFSTWDNNNGITIDHFFQGSWTGLSGTINEGLWAIVRRSSTAPGDNYIFTSIQTGKLRIAFANASTEQYKFTFNGSAANPTNQEYAPELDIPLTDNTPYRLTVSLGNGQFNVWLDDVNGDVYSNAAPVFSDDTIIPDGYNWQLPAAGAVSSSGGQTGRQTREMDIGIRGFGNTGNTVNNFGGTLRSGNWVDEVKIYNGVYAPADLAVGPTTIAGDYNGDQKVDAGDYVIWRKNFPNNSGLATLAMGDGNGDGNITSADYDYWRARYGNPSGSGAGSGLSEGSQVPEPSMVALALCACLAFAMRRSSR